MLRPETAGRAAASRLRGFKTVTHQLKIKHSVLTEVYAVFDKIFEFPDIARPPVVLEPVQKFTGNMQNAPGIHRKLIEKISREKTHVTRPLAQGRHAQGENIEPEIKILAKAA